MSNPNVAFFEDNFLRIRGGSNVQRKQKTVKKRIERYLPTEDTVAKDELRLELLSRKNLQQKTPEDIARDEFRGELLK